MINVDFNLANAMLTELHVKTGVAIIKSSGQLRIEPGYQIEHVLYWVYAVAVMTTDHLDLV